MKRCRHNQTDGHEQEDRQMPDSPCNFIDHFLGYDIQPLLGENSVIQDVMQPFDSTFILLCLNLPRTIHHLFTGDLLQFTLNKRYKVVAQL